MPISRLPTTDPDLGPHHNILKYFLRKIYYGGTHTVIRRVAHDYNYKNNNFLKTSLLLDVLFSTQATICEVLAANHIKTTKMSLQPAIPCTLPPLEAQLPVFPISFPVTFNATESSTPWTMAKINNTNTKLIPRNAFISFRNKPANSTELDDEILGFINTSTHEGWNVYMHGHQEQINFMERYYANTSLLWAIKLISPVAGASISDVWRVAVLYAFGGMYIDDDAWWSKSLESFVGSNDALIVATEPGPYRDDCYRGDFHLSKPILETKANRTIVYNDFWRGRRLAQFAFFSQPRHPVLGRFLINIVEQLRLEYMESSPVYRRGNDPRWKIIVCATGPDIWTTTMYEMMIEKDKGLIPDLNMRVIERAFEAQGCYFKIQEAKHVIARKSSHYYGQFYFVA